MIAIEHATIGLEVERRLEYREVLLRADLFYDNTREYYDTLIKQDHLFTAGIYRKLYDLSYENQRARDTLFRIINYMLQENRDMPLKLAIGTEGSFRCVGIFNYSNQRNMDLYVSEEAYQTVFRSPGRVRIQPHLDDPKKRMNKKFRIPEELLKEALKSVKEASKKPKKFS